MVSKYTWAVTSDNPDILIIYRIIEVSVLFLIIENFFHSYLFNSTYATEKNPIIK